jgi:putative endonuclease
MLYTVYILFSAQKDRYYVGCTSDVVARLIRHNQKSKGFTGVFSDWIIVYKEEFLVKEVAYAREKEIKKWKSRKMIVELIAKNN